MDTRPDLVKLLGIAYLVQFVGSLLSDPLFDAGAGSGIVAEQLVNIAGNSMLVRASVIVQMITAIGIIAMTVFLYNVLRKQNRSLALLALSFWLVEAILLILSAIASHTLIPLSIEYLQAGTPDPSLFTSLGILVLSLKEFSFAIHMLFFGLGGVIWYYLFYRSGFIPRALALWALVCMPLAAVDALLFLMGFGLDSVLRMVVLLPMIAYLPYEGILGIWFIVKGIDDQERLAE